MNLAWLQPAKRQLEKAGIAYEALDNGFRTGRDAPALQKFCERHVIREQRAIVDHDHLCRQK